MKTMESRKSVRNLAETIHSLMGLKAHFTSSWVNSVCDIVKNLPSERPEDDNTLKPGNFEKTSSYDKEGGDLNKVISKIKDELAALSANINLLNIQRRQTLNDFLDMKGNIRVFCRVRPITTDNNFGCSRPIVASGLSNVLLKLAETKSKSYSFDKVFPQGSSQDEVFSEVEPVIKSVLDGYNACIFAYGQTGTGKTFTMEGTPDCPGVVPRAIEALFKQAEDSNHAFLFSFSMLEIYLGNLRDLLIPQSTKVTDPMPPCLSIQTDTKGGIEIDNLVAMQVTDFNQALKLYRLGCRFRSTASTNSNITSSRSHCMIRIAITCFDASERRRETNKLWMVDLGGSERLVKTKACGRRLEEGKAINLSLSALGDVINALQRKKCHIPYRNSKLTQVLKDSLGEDSKTLMLVHVSPKEEDLCETVFSLNFATRVRSIHLGNGESVEGREQKEVAMTNLQQKMKQIEAERQDIRSDIKKLNERLEALTTTTPTFGELLKANHLPIEVPKSNTVTKKTGSGDFTEYPLSHLPGFMRPTASSTRKFGIDKQTSKNKDSVPTIKRRSSRRAESVTFPLNNTSEYNSDCSISRTSCLVDLNMKDSADNETEYSQDTSEYDIKMVVPSEQEKPLKSSVHQKLHPSHGEGNENRKTYKVSSAEFFKVDNWLHLHKNDPKPTSYAPRSKRVPAIPNPKKNIRCNDQNITEKLPDEKVHDHEFSLRLINHDKIEKQDDVGVAGRSFDNTPTLLKDFLNKNCSSNSVSPPSHTTDAEIMIRRLGSEDGLSIEDNTCGTFTLADMLCGRYNQDNDNKGVNGMSDMQVVTSEAQISDEFTLKKNSCCNYFPSDIDNGIIDLKEDSGVSVSTSELEPHYQQVPTDIGMNDRKKEDLHVSSQQTEKGTGPCIYKLRSRRALFMENVDQKDHSLPLVESQGNTQNTGIFNIIKQKIQTLYASALLGLGFQNLGYEHDFFYGLML